MTVEQDLIGRYQELLRVGIMNPYYLTYQEWKESIIEKIEFLKSKIK